MSFGRIRRKRLLRGEAPSMGEIVVRIELENVVDRDRATAGDISEATVRSYTMNALVDTGAVMLSLPQDVVEHLGLKIRRTVVVTYADERKEERPVAGPVTVKIGERFMNTDCIVGPPLSEALIGQVILEELDLVADCQKRTLTPRPESPIYPLLKLKRQAQGTVRRTDPT
jgi:clan AA aspartic protease